MRHRQRDSLSIYSYVLLSLVLAVVAIAAACGGDDNPAAPSAAAGAAGGQVAGADGQAPIAGRGGIPNGASGNNKVVVCHLNNGQFGINEIEVSQNAVSSHRSHGDALPGELVPGSTTQVFDSSCTAVSFGIDLEKATLGEDADAPTGPVLRVGAAVEWTYVATNTGATTLVDVAVTDDQGVVPSCPVTTLAPGASMTCTATGTAQLGQYVNTGTATGTTKGVDGDEQFLIPGNQAHPSDSDASHYLGGTPSVAIEKSTNGLDADTAPGPAIQVGESVAWEYVVTNDGVVDLVNVSVTDSRGIAVDCGGQTSLAIGASMTCTASGLAKVGQYENIGSVEADYTDLGGTTAVVTAEDPSHYFGTRAGIEIQKSTNGIDADTAPGPELQVGDMVTWTYRVTNVGSNALTAVTVSDDRIGVIGGCPTTLDAGESMVCTATDTVTQEGQYENIGTAEGTTPLGDVVSASDPSHYFGVDLSTSGIDIEKFTNGANADSAPGPQLEVGSVVTWTYVVRNTGNVSLANVTVTDDMGVGVDCPMSLLEAGEAMECRGQGIVVMGSYENRGTATGTPEGGTTPVTDFDFSHYEGVAAANASIDIQKTTNGAPADQPSTAVQLSADDPVTWEYTITNDGDPDLTNVTVTDSDETLSLSCDPIPNPLVKDASFTCEATGVARPGLYRNIGRVSATGPSGQVVFDSDPSHYNVPVQLPPQAGIRIEKSTNGQDADQAPGPSITVGSPVTWRYVVTNTGGTALTNVMITDDQEGAVCFEVFTQKTLDPGEVATCAVAGAAQEGQYMNTATVTALNGTEILTATDDSHYNGVNPNPLVGRISIEKSTNGWDDDSAPGHELPIGTTVIWEYVVTNTGDLPLTNISVTDDRIGTICRPAITLNPGDDFSCEAMGVVEEVGLYSNVGSVSATVVGDPDPSGRGFVDDRDASHYTGTAVIP